MTEKKHIVTAQQARHIEVEMTLSDLLDAVSDAIQRETSIRPDSEIRSGKLGYDEDVSRHGSAYYEFQVSRDTRTGDVEIIAWLKEMESLQRSGLL